MVYPIGPFNPSVSPEASEATPYLRTDFPSANVGALCLQLCYRPFVTGKKGFENVPPGTEFGGNFGGRFGPEFFAATPDFRHVVLKSNVALTPTSVERGLYEWTAGSLQLISVLPSNEGGAAVEGSLGNARQKATRAGAISEDGSRVVWAAGRRDPST